MAKFSISPELRTDDRQTNYKLGKHVSVLGVIDNVENKERRADKYDKADVADKVQEAPEKKVDNKEYKIAYTGRVGNHETSKEPKLEETGEKADIKERKRGTSHNPNNSVTNTDYKFDKKCTTLCKYRYERER